MEALEYSKENDMASEIVMVIFDAEIIDPTIFICRSLLYTATNANVSGDFIVREH